MSLSPPKRAQPVAPMEPPPFGVLLIEDEVLIRRALARALARLNCRCFDAGDGQTGLGLLHRAAISIVVVDYHLPDMTGLQVLEAARPDHPQTPFFVYSASLTPTLESAFLQAGATACSRKPGCMTGLMAAIAEALRTDRRS